MPHLSEAECVRPNKRRKRVDEVPVAEDALFSGLRFFVFPRANAKKYKLRTDGMKKNGAEVCQEFDDSVTHIILDASWSAERLLQVLQWTDFPRGVTVVKGAWYDRCIAQNALISPAIEEFQVSGAILYSSSQEDSSSLSSLDRRTTSSTTSKNVLPLNGPDTSSAQDIEWCQELLAITKENIPDWDKIFDEVMSHKDLPNIWTMTAFKIFREYWKYSSEEAAQFRVRNYNITIAKLERQRHKIRTEDEAKSIGIGDKLAKKLAVLVSSGHHDELEEVTSDPTVAVICKFLGVHGIGLKTAKDLYARGYTTLDDVANLTTLTATQRLGIARYTDFNTKIPRETVKLHFEYVKTALKQVDSDAQVHCMGSYRRGKQLCGDIDIMLLKENENDITALVDIKDRLVKYLEEAGFIRCTLNGLIVRRMDDDATSGMKWLGASSLPADNDVWRRLDFFVVKWEERGAAALHCTGNLMLNIKMSMAAIRKGWKLTEHGLFEDNRSAEQRRNKYYKHKIKPHLRLEGASEKKIFEMLGIDYLEPHQRTLIDPR